MRRKYSCPRAGGYTPLQWAVCDGYHRVVRHLLSKGASANVSSKAGITPLLQAAARGHGDVLAELLSKRVDPNLIASDGSSRLLKAIANGHSAVVRVLGDAGASIHMTIKDGTTFFEIAQRSRDPTIRRVAPARYAPSTFEWIKSFSVATIGYRMRNPTPALTV